MKKVCLLILGGCCLGLLTTSTASAAKADGPKAKFFAKYDTNHNGVIDPDEKDAIRKDYAAKPDGDLKKFDTNKDGKLDDAELAAITPPTGKKKADKAELSDFFAKYDKNHNGVIDPEEKDALRKDYAAKPSGDLKKFDRNQDGKLDDKEIAAIHLPTGKKKTDGAEKAGKSAKPEAADPAGAKPAKEQKAPAQPATEDKAAKNEKSDQ